RPEVRALAQVLDGEEERHPEHDQEQQADEGDRCDRDRELVEARPAHEGHGGHHADGPDADEEVGRARGQRVPAGRGGVTARRTRVAGPPVSGSAAVPSAYESATRTNSDPTASRTHGVSPSASSATMPSAKKSDEAISPYATAASEGVAMTRWRPGSFLAKAQRRTLERDSPGSGRGAGRRLAG